MGIIRWKRVTLLDVLVQLSRASASLAGSSGQAPQIHVKTRVLVRLALGLQALLANARRTVQLETATGPLLLS